jgi:hypothetical protein
MHDVVYGVLRERRVYAYELAQRLGMSETRFWAVPPE